VITLLHKTLDKLDS
jgi:hypothetical protein